MKILFICSGNVGRSQMAAAYYNHFTHSQDAMSAGCDPAMPAKWHHPAPEAVQVMKQEGIDTSAKTVKLVTEALVNEADKIVVLCDQKELPAFVLAHPAVYFWDIEDPYQASIETFRKVRDAIKERVLAIL